MIGIKDYRYSFTEWLNEIKTPLMRYQIKAYALNWQLVPNVFIQLTNTTPVLIRVFDKSKIAGMYKKNIVNWTPVKDYFELRMIIKEALNKM